MTMTAPIPLPYATPRIAVEVDIDQLVPVRVLRVPAWVMRAVARLECVRDGHHYGRSTLARDGLHHCLHCGVPVERHA